MNTKTAKQIAVCLYAVLPVVFSQACSGTEQKAEPPKISVRQTLQGAEITISTATSGAKILSSVDDKTKLVEYTGVIKLMDKKVHRVYAIAKKSGMADSELVSVNVYPAGSLMVFAAQNCSSSGLAGDGDTPDPDPTPELTETAFLICSSPGQCEGQNGEYSVWMANWVSGNVKTPDELGTSQFVNQAAANTVGFAIGMVTQDLSKLSSPTNGQIVYGSDGSNTSTVKTDHQILSITPPMIDGTFFAGEAGGKIDQCTVSGGCTLGWLNYSQDITALALDGVGLNLWVGTGGDNGVLMYCPFGTNQCYSSFDFTGPVQSIVVDPSGHVAVATTQGLWSCPAPGSCTFIESWTSTATEPNQLLLANNAIYLASNPGHYIMVYPLPLDANNWNEISNPCNTVIGTWGTDGENIYFTDMNNPGTINVIDSAGTCSNYATLKRSLGCTAFGANVYGIVQAGNVNPTPLTASPTSLTLFTGASSATCAVPPITFTNVNGALSFPSFTPSTYTSVCQHPIAQDPYFATSCVVTFNPIAVGDSGVIVYTNSVSSGTIPYSCSKSTISATPQSVSATAASSVAACAFQLTLGSVWGPLSVTPSGFGIDSSKCTGAYPQSCPVTLNVPPGLSGMAKISDGANTASVAAACTRPTMTISLINQSSTGPNCAVGVKVSNSWEKITLTPYPAPADLYNNSCTEALALCEINWNIASATEAINYQVTDGTTTATASFFCYP
jgi:hypothetical protein